MFLNDWMLASRIRFALVQTAIAAGLVFGLTVLVDGLSALRDGVWFLVLVVLVAFVVNGWVWYPWAKKRRLTQLG